MLTKIRFIEPGNTSPYKKSLSNFFTYNKHIKNPSTGLITLTTIVKQIVDDSLMYSESISKLNFDEIIDADIIFISINTFNAIRGYALADEFRKKSNSIIVFGGMHASLDFTEAIEYCDYILRGDGDELIVEFVRAIGNGRKIDFPGVVYKSDEEIINSGERDQPNNIETIPDRTLVYDYSRLAKKFDTLWPQVHASRGCPHNCDYCSVIEHFGRKVRTRTPENVVEDIRQAIAFHKRSFFPRLNNVVWIKDDNFPEGREWAILVLKAIIGSGIKYNFSVQARFEAGFDDELLKLMKQAGFIELALGIEFLDDDSFKEFHKKSNYSEIVRSIENIQSHGIGVRGLFIVGAERDTIGVGAKIAKFVIDHKIKGGLVQSLFFTPGTKFFESNKHILIHQNWDKYCGNVVHYPVNIKPHELQQEIIIASRIIYSFRRLLNAIFKYKWIDKVLFIGEYFWQINFRKELRMEIENLKNL